MGSSDGRRTKGEGSIYRRESDGRWVGVVDLGWVGGRRVRKTVTAPTKRELTPKFRALQRKLESGVVEDDATVEQWLTYWLEQVAPGRIRPRTIDGYRSYIATWLVPHLGKRKLAALKPDHVRALHKAMADAGKSDATRRQAHAILRRALVVAQREGRILTNPAALVDPPPVGQGRHESLTPAEAQQVIARAVADLEPGRDEPPLTDAERARRLFVLARLLVALLMGLRQGEALGLQWPDVMLRADSPAGPAAHVHQALTRRPAPEGLVLGPVKSKASNRYVPVIEVVAAVLREYRAAVDGTGYVFGGSKPTDPRADYGMWTDALDRAGVRHVPLHGARATCASLLNELGVSPRVVADILGHAQVTTTQAHYIRSRQEQLREALEAAGPLILPA